MKPEPARADAGAARDEAQLLEPFGLDAGQREQVRRLLATLDADALAPSTVRDPAAAVRRHIVDSLVALEVEPVRRAGKLTDIGSGAGFPGLALAIALPAAETALVESNRRRCEFIERMIAAAQIANAHAVWARAEEWQEGIGASDVVLARALAPQPVVLEYAAPLLRLEGALVDWRGRRNEHEERAAQRAALELGMSLVEIRRTVPFAGAQDHHLHVFVKQRATPERFPRRAGMARKRPLGG